MENNLESKLSDFKSIGETRIAEFLSRYSIPYKYESGVVVYPSETQPRIWYPDFYLPDLGIYIEYFGMNGNEDYNQGMRMKRNVYSQQRLPVIPVYPWMFNEDWQGYLFREVKRITSSRYELGRKLSFEPPSKLSKNYISGKRYPSY